MKNRSLTLKWFCLLIAIFLAGTCASVPSPLAAPPTLSGCSLFPADSVWNTPVENLPVSANSSAYITSIGATTGVHPDFGSGLWEGAPIGIPFVTVSGTQPKVPITFTYMDESDPGPYPLPANAPIEGGSASNGDRHVLVLDRDSCTLYEVYRAFPQANGSWKGDSGAVYQLNSNGLRPLTWTSADAAGLPILPGLVRYDEVAGGEIKHAIRFTAPQTRGAFVWPARHQASDLTDLKYPPLGQRFRLKASFNTSAFSPHVRVILNALKKYGMILADNGSSWYISGAPDGGWDNDQLVSELRNVKGSDFEAVEGTALMIVRDSGQALATPDTTPPAQPVRLVFIHHSTGQNWLDDSNGGLGIALRDNNYFTSDTNYGWGPDEIGNSTDIGNWWQWFRGPNASTYLSALYAESGQHSSYSRLSTTPSGDNEVVLFKSCFPNSALQGDQDDPVPPIDSNPLRGNESGSTSHTLANAKGIYTDLLEYFRTRQDKLFIVITAPPLSDGTNAANARLFNDWLVNSWLKDYPFRNVAVFDFYNVLTTNNGSTNSNDLGLESGNHHRFRQGAIQHKTDGDNDPDPNVLEYASSSGDDHPSRAGNLKATAELIPLLNVFYHHWKAGDESTPRLLSVSTTGTGVGTVTTLPPGITCPAGPCSLQLAYSSTIALHATPGEYCLFSGWSGACSGTTDCTLTMDSDRGVTASFARDTEHMSRIGDSESYFPSLQAAYDGAPAGSVIKVWGTDFTENLTCGLSKKIELKGGYDGSYTSNSGHTLLKGQLVIARGQLILENLTIQ